MYLVNLYEIAFPKMKIKLNSKTGLSSWITRDILKSSKHKQKLYENFLNRSSVNLGNYKTFAALFESIKRKYKKTTTIIFQSLMIWGEHEIGPKLASKVPHFLISFKHVLHCDYSFLEEKPILDDELNEALQTWITYDGISSEVI